MTSYCIFLLEDDHTTIATVRFAIKKFGGPPWRLEVSETVSRAFDAIRASKPNLILLDIQLPDGSGLEVCRQMRSDPPLAKVPVIFLTQRGDVESRLQGFAAGGQDYITKPFSMEELLARMRVHLSLGGELDSMLRQKQEAALRERLRSDLIDMLIHDLRTPIATVKSTLDILQADGIITSDKHRSLLTVGESAAEFLLILVNDLFDLRSGLPAVKSAPLDLGALATRLKAVLEATFRRGEVSLITELAAGRPAVWTDQTLVLRILANLLHNASKFSKTGDRVVLRARPSGTGLRLEVEDRGPGIPDLEKEKIFEMYYRADTEASRLTPGTGIGLAFCKRAAESLKGRIWVEDTPRGGSRFILEIPTLGG